jgi:hypothetical protein
MDHPYCRLHLAPRDVEFLMQVLDEPAHQRQALHQLLQQEDTLALLCDHPRLQEALLERPECLALSSEFYFYLLTRLLLREGQLPDPLLADYLAGMLAAFAQNPSTISRPSTKQEPEAAAATESFFSSLPPHAQSFLEVLQRASAAERFQLQARMGDAALFCSGLFPEWLEARREHRAAPGLEFYEAWGQAGYRSAAGSRHANRRQWGALYERLADEFHTLRLALNQLADRFLHWQAPRIIFETHSRPA